MSKMSGSNKRRMKLQNLGLVLRLVATRHGMSRVDIAKATGLTKMTAGNIVAELIEQGIVAERTDSPSETAANPGRNPIALDIAAASPRIVGVSIKRGLYQFVLGDLAGNIIRRFVYQGRDPLTAKTLMDMVIANVDSLRRDLPRPPVGVGVACIGPIDSVSGDIVDPTNFFGIRDVPIVDTLRRHTGLPVHLINDANAGALAEKTYGAGRDLASFIFLHFMYGIGAGFVLEDKLYDGSFGQSGELGHSTINFDGPRCPCGNTGCLELYANIERLRDFIREAPGGGESPLLASPPRTILDVIDAANAGDGLALAALDQFCGYLAHAVNNAVHLLDLGRIITDYRSAVPGDALESLLSRKILANLHAPRQDYLRVERSRFNGDSPVIGALALIANKVFQNELPLFEK